MASFSYLCPKTSALCAAGQPSPRQKEKHHSAQLLVRSDFKSSRSLLCGSSHSQASSRNQNDIYRVALEKSSNSMATPEIQSGESMEKSPQIPDASSITAFMKQVADLVELVDSRDIVELQLKQLDCEVLIKKKEALPQVPVAPIVMMQSPLPQAMASSPLPSPQVAPPASSGPASSPPPLAPTTPAKPASSHPPLKCPMAGTFYRSPAPGAPSFVKVGDKVQKGQVICIIEAMKLMNEIEADQSGTIVDILVEDGKPVSLDMPLLVIEP